MEDNRTLATPQSIVWEYYECLKRQIIRVPLDENDRTQKQELALCLFLTVSVVESFINVFFRVVVSESEFKKHESRILKDMQRRISLEGKLREWPKRIFGKKLDYSKPSVKCFINLKNSRNLLMHFNSTHETVNLPDKVVIHGLADISDLRSLNLEDANKYPEIVEGFVYEVFRLRGISEERLPHSYHHWFGEPPSYKSMQPDSQPAMPPVC